MKGSWTALLLLATLTLVYLPAHGKRKRNSNFAFSYRNVSHNDLQSSETTTQKVDLGETTEFEIGIRFHSIYQLIFLNGYNEEDTRDYIGAGIRIDTLGPFWLARNTYRAVRNKARYYPVNTSFFAAFQKANIKNVSGVEEAATETTFGFTLDIFLFNPYVYLTGQAGVLHSQGNAFTSYSFGLGAEF